MNTGFFEDIFKGRGRSGAGIVTDNTREKRRKNQFRLYMRFLKSLTIVLI